MKYTATGTPFSSCPEAKGIETEYRDDQFRERRLFSSCPEAKGIETSCSSVSIAPTGQFSSCPEAKGIETIGGPAIIRSLAVQQLP